MSDFFNTNNDNVENNDQQINNSDGNLNDDQNNNQQTFNSVQLTQISKPSIIPEKISFNAAGYSKSEKKDFLTGIGTIPVIYYNGVHIEYSDIHNFELYHEGILPAIKIIFTDRNGIFKDSGFPTDDTTISIFIYSRSKRLRSINMDFKVSNFKDMGANDFSINGIVNIPQIFLRKFKSYSKKTSFETLSDIAIECGLGFSSNISNTNDKMTWINTGFPLYQFISNIVKNSYLDDSSFMSCYIDYYYNICYVDIEKELNRNNEDDKMIVSNGKNEFTSDPEQDEDIAPLILSTDKSVKSTNAYISSYSVMNKSTQVSLNKAYLTKTKFYDVNKKELLIFNIDSITSEGDKTIILKGKPGDEEYFNQNISNIWVGKLDKFEEDGSGNAHINFNYSLIQNEINIDEINKISIDITIPNPNFNLYKLQKIHLSLINVKPGINHDSLRYKRLTGNWLITSISFIFDGNSHYQKLFLIKRELELDPNEQEINNNKYSKSNRGDDNYDDINSDANLLNTNNNNDKISEDINGNYISLKQLKNISGVRNDNLLQSIIGPLNDTLHKYNINTKLRITNFLAQVLHESGGFQYFTEFASGSAYEGRSDLGNVNSGDGVKYKGRGSIQVTGRANYKQLSKDLGYDFINDPKKLSTLPWAISSAGWFWNLKKLNSYADKDDIISITKKINGGQNGLSGRRRYKSMATAEYKNVDPGNGNLLIA